MLIPYKFVLGGGLSDGGELIHLKMCVDVGGGRATVRRKHAGGGAPHIFGRLQVNHLDQNFLWERKLIR